MQRRLNVRSTNLLSEFLTQPSWCFPLAPESAELTECELFLTTLGDVNRASGRLKARSNVWKSVGILYIAEGRLCRGSTNGLIRLRKIFWHGICGCHSESAVFTHASPKTINLGITDSERMGPGTVFMRHGQR